MRLFVVFLALFVLSGCATISERYSSQHERHPCGNVLDICPGDSAALDRIHSILNGQN